MSLKKILVVDDSPTIREILVRMLIDAGYMVETAEGADAIDAAPNFAPDLILLDLWMPDMTGIEVSHRLHANPATRNIPIVLMSGDLSMADNETRDLCVAVLEKPFLHQDVLTTVKRCMPSALHHV